MRSSMMDITDQQKAWEIVDRLATAVDQSINIIVMTDADGRIEYINPAFEKVTGYSREEVLGKTPGILKSGHHDKQFYRELWETISSGRVWTGRIINKKKDGTLYHEEMSISPVRGEDNEIVNFVAVQNDITQQVELEKQLRHAQKMESIGLLAGGVAHDFNNILTSIIGYSSLLSRKKDLPEKTLKRIDEIGRAARRGAEITKQLLTFSRSGETAQKVVDVREVVDQTLRLLKRTIGSNIEIETRFGSGKMLVMADTTQLQQVIMNLCINSQKAMPDGGKICISTRKVKLSNGELNADVVGAGGAGMELSVADTGCGMSEEVLQHIFEPFFTTRDVGEGTGLGLSIVYGIVKNHKGTIMVDSTPGEGTEFRIFLPLTSKKPEDSTKRKARVRGGDETVMIVDDSDMVLRLAGSILEEYGYTCLRFLDPLKALDRFRENPEDIDIAVLDVVMPGMSGIELFEKMREIRPDFPALISSGYSMQNREAMLEMGVAGFVPKPYEEETLARSVRELLDGKKVGEK